jgi:hypothetical protein
MSLWHRSGARVARTTFKPILEPLEGRDAPAASGLSAIAGDAAQLGMDAAAKIADTARLVILEADSDAPAGFARPTPQQLASARATVAQDAAALSRDTALVGQDLSVIGEGLRQVASDPDIRSDLGKASAHAREYLTGVGDEARGAALEALGHALGVSQFPGTQSTAESLVAQGRSLAAKGKRKARDGRSGLAQDLGAAYRTFLSHLSKDLSLVPAAAATTMPMSTTGGNDSGHLVFSEN